MKIKFIFVNCFRIQNLKKNICESNPSSTSINQNKKCFGWKERIWRLTSECSIYENPVEKFQAINLKKLKKFDKGWILNNKSFDLELKNML